MKNKILHILFLLMAALHVTHAAHARSTLDLGNVGVSAKLRGMGKAGVSIARNAEAVFANPAGIAFSDAWGFSSMSTTILSQADYKMFSAVCPTNYGVFGFGYIGATTPAGLKTTGKTLTGATPISYGSSFFNLSYGQKLPLGYESSFGVNLKYLSSQFEGVSGGGTGFSADLGAVIRLNQSAGIGFNLKNIGGGVNWDTGLKEKTPTLLTAGGSYRVNETLLAAADFDINQSGPSVIHAGIEWNPDPMFALRAGLDQSATGANGVVNDFTIGTGFKSGGFSFDYAFKTNTLIENNSSQYFSISYQAE